jgi:mRNA interferase RelE/StbE
VHRLEITRLARKQIDALPRTVQRRIDCAIEALVGNPRPSGSLKLTDRENTWRIRVGQYRVVYEVHDDVLIVVIVRVAHRRDAYR